MRLNKTGQIKNVAYSTENLKSGTGWELAVRVAYKPEPVTRTECMLLKNFFYKQQNT